MAFFDWNSSLEFGIASIDEQHKNLVQLNAESLSAFEQWIAQR